MNDASNPPSSPFMAKLEDRLWGVRRWQDLDALWLKVKAGAESGQNWYAYCVGEPLPAAPLDAAAVARFVDELDVLLHRDHHEDYCGIVYVDDLEAPTLFKIYDPNNLGYSCGSSGKIIPPGWTLSLDAPCELQLAGVMPEGRRRWWQKLFS